MNRPISSSKRSPSIESVLPETQKSRSSSIDSSSLDIWVTGIPVSRNAPQAASIKNDIISAVRAAIPCIPNRYRTTDQEHRTTNQDREVEAAIKARAEIDRIPRKEIIKGIDVKLRKTLICDEEILMLRQMIVGPTEGFFTSEHLFASKELEKDARAAKTFLEKSKKELEQTTAHDCELLAGIINMIEAKGKRSFLKT